MTTAQSDETAFTSDANGYGDYTGVAVLHGTTRPLWTDSRSGSEEIFTAAIRPTPVSVPVPADPRQIDLAVPSIATGSRPVRVGYRVGDEGGPMRIDVFSVTGSLVRRLAKGVVGKGEYVSVWDLGGNAAHRVANGVYLVRLTIGGQALTRRIVIL